jgi:hypothetical protein
MNEFLLSLFPSAEALKSFGNDVLIGGLVGDIAVSSGAPDRGIGRRDGCQSDQSCLSVSLIGRYQHDLDHRLRGEPVRVGQLHSAGLSAAFAAP